MATEVSDLPASVPGVAPPASVRDCRRAWPWLVLIVLVGAACRAGLAGTDGHLDDVRLFARWMRGLTEYGLGEFFEHDRGANYPPLHMLTLRGLGWALTQYGGMVQREGGAGDTPSDVENGVEVNGDEGGNQGEQGDEGDDRSIHNRSGDQSILDDDAIVHAALRLPACLADLLITLLLFAEVRRLYGSRAGAVAAGLYFLNPVSIYVSAYWGQVDSIHTLFILAALTALNRHRPAWAGAAGAVAALALLQKLQSVAFLPLIILVVYQRWRWRGLAWLAGGAVFAVAVVLAPFVVAGSAEPALRQGYGVVGQYPRLSINAYNLWFAFGGQDIGDNAPPSLLIRAAADGATQVAADAAWYLGITWRRVASAAFALITATVLSLYARRPSADARALAASALGLAFFLFLTEMHERYAFPVIALLAVWAARSAARERIFALISILMLLNLTGPQPVDQVAFGIGTAAVALFCVLVGALAWGDSGRGRPAAAQTASVAAPVATAAPPAVSVAAASAASPAERVSEGRSRRSLLPRAEGVSMMPVQEAAPRPSRLIRLFQAVTGLAWLAGAALVAGAVVLAQQRPTAAPAGAVYLGDLTPKSAQQGFGRLRIDREVEGGPIRLADTYYVRGLGTHAPATLVYEVPPGAQRFEAVAGVDRMFDGRVDIVVLLDGREVFRAEKLGSTGEPARISVSVEGVRELTLRVKPDGPQTGDHVDFGDARFITG